MDEIVFSDSSGNMEFDDDEEEEVRLVVHGQTSCMFQAVWRFDLGRLVTHIPHNTHARTSPTTHTGVTMTAAEETNAIDHSPIHTKIHRCHHARSRQGTHHHLSVTTMGDTSLCEQLLVAVQGRHAHKCQT